MENKPSLFWRFAALVALIFLAAALYVQIVPFREFVDDKCPWIKEQLAQHGIHLEGSQIFVDRTPDDPASPKSRRE